MKITDFKIVPSKAFKKGEPFIKIIRYLQRLYIAITEEKNNSDFLIKDNGYALMPYIEKLKKGEE